MNVPVQILEHLKCSNCEDLLSCGPVLVKQDGSDICGRCSNLGNSAVPNKPYNELAEMCMFPCKYEAQGCFKKISFSCMQQHEAGCEFRTYVCPVMPSGSCEWIGARNGILEHTLDAHPEKVLQHPCEMEHDVRTTSLKTFLTTAFDVLFIVFVKVCLETHTIYHSVRRIGDTDDGRTFSYDVHMGNDSGIVIKKGEVASQGCLAMQEDTSIPVRINTLMEVLNGFTNATFLVRIQDGIKCYGCKVITNPDQTEVHDKINNIFYCENCSLALHYCKNASKGCKWKGSTNNINHNELFCSFTKWCPVCNKNVEEFNMMEHNRSANHLKYTINHSFGKYWQMQHNKKEFITISIHNMSYLLNYYCKRTCFYIQCSYDSANRTKCVLILRNPKTKFVTHFIMHEYYSLKHGQFLWKINLQDDKLQTFMDDGKFDVGVDIYYND